MIQPVKLFATLVSACVALFLPSAPILADSDPHTRGEKTAVPPYVPRGGAVVRTVGPDGACDFSNLQTAINASNDDDVLRVMSGTYTGGFSIASKALSVIGGFPDCTSTTPTGRSTLDRQGNGLVLDIFYQAAVGDPIRQVNIENMIIRNGGGSGFFSGGAVVEGRPGRLAVNFRNVQISDNNRTGTADDGAGLRVLSTGDVDGGGAFVTLDNDSIVSANTTAGDGGGVYCRSTFDDGTLTMLRMGTTLVFNNQAENGGGVAVDGCQNVFLYNGGPVVFFIPTGGILGNTANLRGGGLFLDNGAEVTMRATEFNGFGDPSEAALLAGNTASSGGAAAIIGTGTELEVEDAYVINNTADSLGGAFNVRDGSTLEISRRTTGGACEPVASGGGVLSRPPCSVIEDNSGNGGGAFAQNGDSNIDVSRTIIRDNTSGGGGGPVARVRNGSTYTGSDSQFRMEGSVVHGNSGGFVFSVVNNARVEIYHSTVADNPSTLGFVVAQNLGQSANLNFYTSIIQTNTWLGGSGDGERNFGLDCVIGNAPVGDTGATNTFRYSEVDPQFLDPTENDYRLGVRSPAIDYCDGFEAPQFDDLNGNTRGVAWTGPTPDPAPNPAGGDYDLGAFEIPFEVQNTDIAVESTAPARFISGDSFSLELELTNQGANTAFGDISVIDDFTTGAVVNQQWTCTPPSGVTCSPSSGSGDMTTAISDLEPGQSVMFEVTADPSNPGSDQEFEYILIATESSFNLDTNVSNNEALIEIRTGLFADGFEGTP